MMPCLSKTARPQISAVSLPVSPAQTVSPCLQRCWTAHATYGRQLEAEFLERLLPDSTAEIRAYLSSRAVRGVGPKTAEKIVAAFGTDSLKILEAAPERLTEIDGISRKKALEIGASFRQQVAVRRLIEFLAGYRIPAQVAVRLYRVYGAQSLERVQEDPYLLAQPQGGAGFGAADQLALELGFDGDDARREHPEATLSELAELHEPPTSKSTVNHRMRKLLALAAEGTETTEEGPA